MTVESTQVFRGSVTPEMAEFLTHDGESLDRGMGQIRAGHGVAMQFHEEKTRTFECCCGRSFRKPETAREHLEEAMLDG